MEILLTVDPVEIVLERDHRKECRAIQGDDNPWVVLHGQTTVRGDADGLPRVFLVARCNDQECDASALLSERVAAAAIWSYAQEEAPEPKQTTRRRRS